MVFDTPECCSSNHDSRLGTQPRQQPQHGRLRHRHASCGRPEILARQMQEYRAAAAGDARGAVVIDLDNEIIEMVVARQSIAAATGFEPYRPVVMAALRSFAPGVPGPNVADGEEFAWPSGA